MKSLFVAVALIALPASHVFAVTPGNNWLDSYSFDGQCYCITTFDHDAGTIVVDTPAGPKTTVEVCEAIGPGPGVGSNPIYNDLQCGNGPPNSAADETTCPGRVDLGAAGCSIIGPTWNLDQYFSAPGSTTGGAGAHTGTDTGTGTDAGTSAGTTPETNSGAVGGGTTGTDAGTDSGAESGSGSSIPVQGTPIELTVLPDDLAQEAMDFSSKDDRWTVIDPQWSDAQSGNTGSVQGQLANSFSGSYLKLLPDTRVVTSDPVSSDNEWPTPGDGPHIHFEIEFDQAGDYEVLVRMFSSGEFDDSLSVGLDGLWLDVSSVLNTCDVRGAWTWSNCDNTDPVVLAVPNAGVHTVQFSAMDDGVELDRFVLRRTSDPTSEPVLAQAVSVGDGIAFGAGGLGLLSLTLLMALHTARHRIRLHNGCGGGTAQ